MIKNKIKFSELYEIVDGNLNCPVGCNICECGFMQFLPGEIEYLSKEYKISKECLGNRHVVDGREVWMIKDDEDDCVFYKNGRCSKREVRCLDCRTYPAIPYLEEGVISVRLDDRCPLVKNKMIDQVFLENALRAWRLSNPPDWWMHIYKQNEFSN